MYFIIQQIFSIIERVSIIKSKKYNVIILTSAAVMLAVIMYAVLTQFALSGNTKADGVLYETFQPIPLKIERIDYSLKNDNGKTVGITYYDKPVLSGETESDLKISKYFEDECREFFFGETRINFDGAREYGHFEEFVNRSLEPGGLLTLEESSFRNTVDTKVAFFNNEILSFSEI